MIRMANRCLSAAMASAIALLCPSTGRAADSRPASPALDSAVVLFDCWARAKLAERGDPGISMAIVAGDEIVYTAAYGPGHPGARVRITPATVFPAGSMMKMLTATRIMQLRDQGLLSLDDPLTKHLPWLALRGLDPANPPTIEQVLTHTSGIPREPPFQYWTDGVFPDGGRLMESLESAEMLVAPGTRWVYSNLGYALLGLVIERLARRPFAEDIHESILAPLGMSTTSVGDGAATTLPGFGRRLADGTRAVRAPPDTKAMSPALGLFTTACDMARFMSLQFAGPGDETILDFGSVREMHREHWPLPQFEFAVGLGFDVKRAFGATVVGHDGAMAGYRCRAACRPADKVAAVSLACADDADPEAFVDQALRMISEAVEEDRAGQPDFPEAPASFTAFLGHYRSPLLSWEGDVIVYRGRLALYSYEFPPAPDPRAVLVWLEPVEGKRFRMTGPAGNGEPVLFEPGPDGRIARAKMGENWVTRER